MKEFEYYIERFEVRKVLADGDLAFSLIKDMEGRVTRAFKLDSSEFPKEIFENVYDALRDFCDALLAIAGYKSYSHEASISYLMKKGFDYAFIDSLDKLRYKRNSSKYYGKIIGREEAESIKKFYADNKQKIYNLLKGSGLYTNMAGKVEEKVKKYLEKIKKEDGKIKAFLYVNPGAVEDARAADAKKKKGRLYGFVFGVKSNINIKGMPVSCASKTLEDYKGTFDAMVIEKIKAEDGIIIGITNCDEFACGSSGENSAFGATANPIALGKIPGGSSSGSAACVAAGFCDVSLGSDTGGSIRNPASHCGIIGVKPSYGCVSRYGLVDLSMSLDQIGVFAKNIADAALVLDVIKGKDERDTKTFESKPVKLADIRKVRVGILRIKGVDKKIQELVDNKVEEIKKKLGWEVREIKVEHIDLAVQTYYPLVYTEFFSATRRFDGRRYGKKIEDVCGIEVARRILGGSEITKAEFKGAYYQKALDAKEIIKEEFEKVFSSGIDCVILPTCPGLPWAIGAKMKVEEVYAYDALTIPANLAEICALSMPAGSVNKIPVGMQVMCAKGEEGKMLSIAGEIEKLG